MSALRDILYCLLFALVVIVYGCSQKQVPVIQNDDHIFGYITLSGDGGLALDELNSTIAIGDVSLTANYCNDKSNYQCVESKVFYFAVPKTINAKQEDWELDGHAYHVEVPLHNKTLFGKRLQVEIISTVGPKSVDAPAQVIYYLYSPERGLLAIGYPDAGNFDTKVLISTSDIGFAAQAHH